MQRLQWLARRGRGPGRPHSGCHVVARRLARQRDTAALRRVLTSKGVVANREVVIYGTDDDETRLRPTPSPASAVPDHDAQRRVHGWVVDPGRPVERMPRYERLVSVEWLDALLAGERPEAAPDGRFVLFHVNFGGPAEFAEGHIPGAAHLDTLLAGRSCDWNRRPAVELADRAALGITRDTTVIVYGRDSVG